jgi:hypothetical protein
MGKESKSKEDIELDELEAKLMGGEIAEETPKEDEELSVQPDAESESTLEPQDEDVETIQAKVVRLQEERNSLEQAVRQEREAKKQAERTMATLLDRIEAAQKEREGRESIVQERIPNRDEDPAGYLAWQQERTLAEIRELKEERQQERQLTRQEQEQRTFLTEYQRQLDEFASKTPDYNDAANFLAKNRDEELQALGIYDPHQRQQMLHQDALQIGAFCMQQGRNPAQTFYELARKRGFQGKPPAHSVENQGKEPNQPKSLSTIGGRSPGQQESLQARADRIINTTRWNDIADLDEKEIDKVLRQMG